MTFTYQEKKIFQNPTTVPLARLAFMPKYWLDAENDFLNNSFGSLHMASNPLSVLQNANGQRKDCWMVCYDV